ncbi:MAG TPA: hypothetical protein VHL53_03195 [Acidimicrobiia bacterium]|nr:hypothetical protein [Acidimicrobiia bacterium]
MTTPTHPVPRRGPAFWIGAAAGWALIAYGLRGVLHHSLDTRPSQLARFWIGGALLHDLLLAPAVLGLGVVVARAAPRFRRTLQQALIVIGPLVLFTYPEIRGYAHGRRNPTSLPHNYTANLLVVVGAVGLACLVAARRYRARARATATIGCGGGSSPSEP